MAENVRGWQSCLVSSKKTFGPKKEKRRFFFFFLQGFPLFSAFVTSSLLRHHLYYVIPVYPQLPLTLFIYFASYHISLINDGEICLFFLLFICHSVSSSPSSPPSPLLRSTSIHTLPLSVSIHHVPNISSEYKRRESINLRIHCDTASPVWAQPGCVWSSR